MIQRSATPEGAAESGRARRAFWLKHIHAWHWVSSAVCLAGMIGFAITGITLNHAADIEGQPRTSTATARLPIRLLATLQGEPAPETSPVSASVAAYIERELSVGIADRAAEWSQDEIYVALPIPGGDAFVTIDRRSGDVRHERTDRGWVSYLNDLHKGRNTGRQWSWFLDVFAVGSVVFCVTGLFLLQMHARQRPTTWPVVGLGLVVPLLIALLLIH